MSINSRAKGKRVELAACRWIAATLGIAARRTAQVDGGLSADVVTEPDIGLHIEVKGRKRIAAFDFIRQAERDASPGRLPVVLMFENGDTHPVLMVRLEKLPELCEAYATAKGQPVYPREVV